jgi:hypothetical protein
VTVDHERTERRASYGRAAVAAGTPDLGQNGEGLEGVKTDAVDAVANILLYVASETTRVTPDIDIVEMIATSVLDSATTHFRAELRGYE